MSDRRSRSPRSLSPLALALLAGACAGSTQLPVAAVVTETPRVEPGLRSPAEFASITDRDERARAIFLEASRVMLHPRCKNCHPAGDTPLQDDTSIAHDPPVVRGPDDHGVPGLECTACHQDANVELARVPGAPGWHLAPKVMAWVGRTPHALCEQVKDPVRNGGKNLAALVEHSAHDKLVAWGWTPGHGRTKAPGTQAEFGALIAAWVADGAACPVEKEEARR